MKSAIEYIFNATLAIIVLTLLLPVCFWIIWKLYREGTRPVIFTQTRVGKNGHNFILYKFRSMLPEVSKDRPFICQSYEDPRITEFGRFLRRKKLDEFPQLINIIKGEMNFVGPRPEIPYFHEINLKNIPNWGQRITVKPGITGLAQLHSRITHDPAEKIIEDLKYISNRSPLMDIKIIWETATAWFGGRAL